MATKFFISYRRSDSSSFAELLYQRLALFFGRSCVFFDREKIELGEAFARVIDERVASCHVVFAIVGPNWLTSSDEHGRRIDSPRDYVRHEIASALKQSKRVIPLLIRDASMPPADELPDDLKPFAGLNAERIRESDVGADLRTLIQKITGIDPGLLYLAKRFHHVVIPLASAAVLAIFFAAWVQFADLFNLDTRAESYTMWLGDLISPPRPHSQVEIVAIGESAQTYFKRRFDKTWRREHARFITLLSEAGAAVIAFDVFMDEPSAADEEFAAAISAARHNGTIVIFGTEHGGPPNWALRNTAETALLCVGKKLGYATIAPLVTKHEWRALPALAAAAPVQGDNIGASHRESQAAQTLQESRLVPSLALVAVLKGGKLDRIEEEALTILALDAAGRVKQVRFSRYEDVPTGPGCLSLAAADPAPSRKVAQLIVQFTPLDQLRSRTYRYESVFDEGRDILSQRFRGKIVLVGKEDQSDSTRIFRGHTEEWRFGFEVHADTLNTLSHEISIRSLDAWHQFWIMILVTILGQLAIWRNFSSTGMRRTYLLGTAVVYVALGIWAYIAHHILLNTVYHLGAFFLSYWIALKVARSLRVIDTRGG